MWVPVKRARASQLRGILVRLKAQRVHFLQASAWSAGDGEKVGEYVVRYADGQQRAIPLLYQRSLIDWWVKGDFVSAMTRAAPFLVAVTCEP